MKKYLFVAVSSCLFLSLVVNIIFAGAIYMLNLDKIEYFVSNKTLSNKEYYGDLSDKVAIGNLNNKFCLDRELPQDLKIIDLKTAEVGAKKYVISAKSLDKKDIDYYKKLYAKNYMFNISFVPLHIKNFETKNCLELELSK